MTTTVIGKTVSTSRLDTNILSGVTLDGEVPVTSGFAVSSTKSAGFIKAVNMFYKTLFTQKGSDPHDINMGTELPDLFQSSIYDEEILFASVKRDVDDALSQVVEFQTTSDADNNEKLSGVRIVKFKFTPSESALDFSVELYNLAGELAVLEVPSTVVT